MTILEIAPLPYSDTWLLWQLLLTFTAGLGIGGLFGRWTKN